MILNNLNDHIANGVRTISMDIAWEDNDRPGRRLYFAAEGQAAEYMRPSPDAFAIACLPVASWSGERRLRVEGKLCTRMRSGLNAINQVYAGWYAGAALVAIEPTAGYHPTTPPPFRRTASLLSGGVDGLSTLRRNRLDYPLEHPESIRACITLFGINNYDVSEVDPVPERVDAFKALLERLGGLAEAEHFELLPVRTNVRSIGLDYHAWTRVGFGPAHIAVAQLFQGHFDKVLFSSDGAGPNPPPTASHPLVNACFSTNAVTVQSDQDEMSRLEKVELLADWEWARRLMQPCHYIRIPEAGKINCGRCEKCVRTMLTLIGLGRLDEVSAFADKDVTPRMIEKLPVHNEEKALLLAQSIPLLLKVGRGDLARAIRKRVWRYRWRKLYTLGRGKN